MRKNLCVERYETILKYPHQDLHSFPYKGWSTMSVNTAWSHLLTVSIPQRAYYMEQKLRTIC